MISLPEGVRCYRLEDQWEILVGKTAKDNDILSIKIGKPSDFWFHVAGMAGSHVIARHASHPEQCPRQVKKVAAGLAAFFGKGRSAKKIAVHYTTCKNVSKRRGAPAGQVQLKRFETIMAEPIDPHSYFGGTPCR